MDHKIISQNSRRQSPKSPQELWSIGKIDQLRYSKYYTPEEPSHEDYNFDNDPMEVNKAAEGDNGVIHCTDMMYSLFFLSG